VGEERAAEGEARGGVCHTHIPTVEELSQRREGGRGRGSEGASVGRRSTSLTCEVSIELMEELLPEDRGCVVVHLIGQRPLMENRVGHLPGERGILHRERGKGKRVRGRGGQVGESLTWNFISQSFALAFTAGSGLWWRAEKAERNADTPEDTEDGGDAGEEEDEDHVEGGGGGGGEEGDKEEEADIR
jgi:hypothetical protein